jgi:tRNA 5-methylaminomethyl-2-thiouridine biosynthesis bifunctional protein
MGAMLTVPTAVLERNAGGVPFSSEFADIYHPAEGGLAQARYVFLEGNEVAMRWGGRDRFVILETGFGLGLNFLAAWHAWRAGASRPRRLHFVSVEHRPLTREDLAAALAPFDELQSLARALLEAWPPPFAGFHRLHFDGGNVVLTLLLGDASDMLPRLTAAADALFLDGFAPARNPAIWSPEVVRELRRLAAPGATLATWTVAGGVRSALAGAGFTVDKRPGFGGKREMLVGRLPATGDAPVGRERHALVVGAGLAGTLVAERLAARDWQVDLVEARADRSVAAVGLLRPVVNLRDAVNAQASRAAFFFALQHLRALQEDGFALQWKRCGVLQLAQDAAEADRFEAIVRSQGYPPSFLQFVGAGDAGQLARRVVRGPGWWFPEGAWVSPRSLLAASLARAGGRVSFRTGRAVARLEREGHLWRALDANDRVIAESAIVVVANAADAGRLLPQSRMTLGSVRGQLTYLPPSAGRVLDIIVSGTGYVAPLLDGGHAVGATYQHEDDDPAVRGADHQDNLARAEAMLPGFTVGLEAARLGGWTGHRTTVPDRLPVFGATELDGVHAATALGSRGLLWAPLGAELLASRLDGEPLPLSRDLAGALSPKRFLS